MVVGRQKSHVMWNTPVANGRVTIKCYFNTVVQRTRVGVNADTVIGDWVVPNQRVRRLKRVTKYVIQSSECGY